jgi:hypothetical protein
MHHTIIVADQFLDDAHELRCKALDLSYTSHAHTDGGVYDGVASADGFDPAGEIERVVRRPVHIDLGFFRLALKGHKLGTIHNDVGESDWAGVLYLCDPECPLSGTAFWTHKGLGWDHMPTAREIEGAGYVPNLVFREMMAEHGRDEKHWTLDGVVGCKFNRFVAYPTAFFHSRYPRESLEAENKELGRLTYSCFFRFK